MNLTHLSNDELLGGITSLLGAHRELTAQLVAHLAEIEDRRLHAIAGYASIFEFCVKRSSSSTSD